MSLLTNLVSHWRLDEASGTRVDVHGGNDLTSNNTVGQSVGKIGSAAHLTAASSQYLSRVSASTFAITGGFTIAAWVYADSLAVAQSTIASRMRGGGGADTDWLLTYQPGAGSFVLYLNDAGNSFPFVVSSLGAASLATWYYVVAWYDPTAGANGTSYLQVNNGAVDSTALAVTPATASAPFQLGAYNPPTDGRYWDGRIDSASFWARVLTPAERTSLYNGGSGFDYPFGGTPHGGSFSDPARVIGSVDGYGSAAVTANQYLTEHVFAFPARLGGVQVHADTAGTGGGATVVDVLLNGTSVYHQTSDRPALDAIQTGLFYQANPPATRAIHRGDTLAIRVASISSTGHARLKAHVAIEHALQRGA